MSSSVLPPAGWYEDPEHAGRHRFWDGSAWTEDRRPAPPAGAPVTLSPGVVCPVCGRSDMLWNVGLILDDGTSTTVGTTRTVSTGYGSMSGMGSDGSLYSGSATMSHTGTSTHRSTTRTQLAARFTPPSRPRAHFGAWFVLGWFGAALVIALLWGPALAPASPDLGPIVMTGITIAVAFVVVLAGTWIVGLAVAFIQRAVTAGSLARRRSAWDHACVRLRAAAYCARDGVAVDGGRALSPEALRQELFPS